MKTCIATLFNTKYFEPVAVMLQSLSDNYHGQTEYDIVCITPGDEAYLVADLKSRLSLKETLNLVSISTESVRSLDIDSKDVEHWGESTLPFYKLFFGSILQGYDKVIFLDADTMVVRDIDPLLTYPMNRPFLATMDFSGDDRVGMENWAIFNTGVFIADLNWWRSSGIEEVFLNHIETKELTFFVDEDIFNVYLRHIWEPISPIFNYFRFYANEFGIYDWDAPTLKTYFDKAIVIHFAGQIKPWNYKSLAHKDDVSLIGSEWRERKNKLFS